MEKRKIPLYLPDELLRQIDAQCLRENAPSRTGFLERAIRFYLEYQAVRDGGSLLPAAVSSAIEGRLEMLEDRVSSLLFKLSVELDMSMSVLASAVRIDEVNLQKLRGECVKEVKRVNGRVSLNDAMTDREKA